MAAPSRLLALLLLLLSMAATVAYSFCHYHEGDAVIERLESRLPSCLQDAAAAEQLQDLVVTHELSGPRRPLAIAAFSSDSATLDALAAALGDAYFGSRRDGMRVVDVHEEIQRSGRDVDDAAVLHAKQTLRRALSTALQQCPRRSLLVLRHADALVGASLSTLDVLLDPLNGARGTLQDPTTGEELDSRGLVALLLFRVKDTEVMERALTKHSWREFLVQRWRDHGPVDEVFTPQAIVGRITGGVCVLQSVGTSASNACRLLPLETHDDGDVPAGVQWIFWAALAVLALLVRAKGWVALRAALQKTGATRALAETATPLHKQKQKQLVKTENAADTASKEAAAVKTTQRTSAVAESSPKTKAQTNSKTSSTAKPDASSPSPHEQSLPETSAASPAPNDTETTTTEPETATVASRPQRSTRTTRAASAMTSPRRQSPRRPRGGRASKRS